MENSFIPENKWEPNKMHLQEYLYGYSHKSQGWYPYKQVTEIFEMGNTKKRIAIKGFAKNGEKLYVQVYPRAAALLEEKGWLIPKEYDI